MEINDAVLEALNKAVALSPESGPLRRHYAEMLLNRGYPGEAEAEFRAALDLDKGDAEAKLGLARALYSQNQHSTALLLVKQVLQTSARPAKAYVLYARLLLALGSVQRAVHEYHKALSEDPEAYDPLLAHELGVDPPAVPPAKKAPEGRAGTPSRPGESTSPSSLRELFTVQPRINLRDVGGLEEIKERVREAVLQPLTHRAFYQAFQRSVGSRVLLYGAPGCGKTHLARAMAGDSLVPFVAANVPDLMGVWTEATEQVLGEVFEIAREKPPAILLFDELEGFSAPYHGDLPEDASRRLVQRLLRELEAGEGRNDGLLIVLTTSAPWLAEPALLRRQRYDHVFFLPPPDAAARTEILTILCRGKPQRDLDYEALGEETAEFSGGDLRALVDRAVEAKLRDSLKAGRPRPLTTDDLRAARRAITPTLGGWLQEARRFVESSAAEADRDDLYGDLRFYLGM